jgi:ubiquinone/menaquinone biosynthesis C-methylase UbiE
MAERKHAIRQAYDDISADYHAQRSEEPAAITRIDDLANRLPSNGRVLDAGCGSGVPVARRLVETHEVVGVDFSTEQVRRARGNVPRARFVQGEMSALAFAANTFDGVCALFSLIHVPLDEHPRVVAEFYRVLRPGGLALFTVGDEEWQGTNPNWLDTGVEMHWSFPDTETSVRHLTEVGFEVLERHTVDDEFGGSFPFLLVEKHES